MFSKSAILTTAAVLAAASLAGCAPVIKQQGYTIVDQSPLDASVGADTMTSVREKYGSPTQVSLYDPNTWYYMAQVTDQFGAYRTHVRSRNIVQIGFDPANGLVKDVTTYSIEDGREIAYSGRETETVGRELGILEQIFSTIGESMLPRQEIDPGNVPGR